MEQFSQNMDPQELLNQLTQQLAPKNENSNNIMKDLLGDIKGMLSGGQNLDTQNIMDLSKDLSVKYQEMIEKGTVNISDLFTGVIDLLNNPDAIGEEFNDIDTNNLPNPNDLIQQMSSDPNLKQAISMMGNMGNTDNKDGNPMGGLNMGGLNMGGLNMGMLTAMMSGMMNTPDASNSNVPKTVQELEKEIERLMTELEGEEEDKQEGEQDKHNQDKHNQETR